MAPKKRRQVNNKENIDDQVSCDPLSIQSIITENVQQLESQFNEQYQSYQKRLEEKLALVHQQFERYLQVHHSQMKLARLLDQELIRVHQKQTSTDDTGSDNQELMNKTTDLMNVSLAETSRTKTYLIGELQQVLPKTTKK